MNTILKKKAVLFDLDGTIIDTIADIAAAVNRAIAYYGYPGRTVDEVQSFLGNGSLMLIRRAIGSDESDEYCKEIRARFREEYEKGMYDLTRPYEGIAELFDELSAKGAKIAVITNKDHRCAEPMIRHYFGDLVDVCRGVTVDMDRKPDTRVTLSVLAEFGVTPEEALFVGDGMPDLMVSRNSGIDFIPVGYGYTDSEKLYSESGKKVAEDVNSLRSELLKYF